MGRGRITIPTDEGCEEITKELAKKWGADAVRDCDGTKLPENAKELADKVYNTYFVVRGDNEWAQAHKEELQNVLLMSERVTATESSLEIELLKGYSKSQLEVNEESPHKYWQVYDRTSGEEVHDWEYAGKGVVRIGKAKKYHEYTVNFFAKNIWDSTQMYNYLTNGWTCEKQMVMEPRYEKTWRHIEENLKKWCEENENVNVVRFTTFLYHFFLVFNEEGKEKHVDWFGYPMTVSPRALDGFEEEYGYRLMTEDIVDGGSYGNNFRVPTGKYLDYMEYVQKYVAKTVKRLVEIVHASGKEAMMFLGDSWIGTEPYGKYFKEMELDAVVGSVGGGVTVRMLSEIPHVKYREGRLLPYFFPDTFYEGNEEAALKELDRNWRTARRALMRKPLERIGYGGYLSLAAKFPRFVDRVGEICEEFREIYKAIGGKKPYSVLKVGILNAWGKQRSWMCFMVAHELWYQQIYSYQGILESLSGQAVEVEFLSFEEIEGGVPKGIEVLINAGDAGTAFSGGEKWRNEKVQESVREYVYNGGGLIGVGEPSACERNGRYFQLADVLGVEEERGFTLSEDKYNIEKRRHFITEEVEGKLDCGEGKKNIYALEGTEVLEIELSERMSRKVNVGEVKVAAKRYGKGRSVYIAGLPYSEENARVLYRAMIWSAGKESELRRAYSTNPKTECNYYPETKRYAVINNSEEEQSTTFYDLQGSPFTLLLKPCEIFWKKSE